MIDIKQLPLGPLQTNCYFLGCTTTKQATIIDPAWDGDKIAAFVAEQGYTLVNILLTHSHFDHIGGLAQLHEAYPEVPVYSHADGIDMLHAGPQAAARYGLTMPTPPAPTHMMVEGDVIAVGELKLEVLFTPGHAPGHVSFYLREHSVVFDGDVLFQGSIGRTDLPGANFTELMDAIQDKLLPLPDETHVLSGHGPATTIGQERQHNPFLS